MSNTSPLPLVLLVVFSGVMGVTLGAAYYFSDSTTDGTLTQVEAVELAGPVRYRDREVQIPVDRPETLDRITALEAELAAAKITIEELQRDRIDLAIPELEDRRLGLSFKNKVLIKACIETFVQPDSEEALLDETEARRRAQIVRDLVDRLVGRDHRTVIQELLTSEARSYGGDNLLYAARHPFHQQLYGYLCFEEMTR